ncbi:hypothetical protein NF681_01420 (plasmid) [Comamonadaceae bacterium OTU4NAUVB1]|nr:hypothetical protein NF681_01420 [Comamonadaceae bacterium OTU4NAUVB1]
MVNLADQDTSFLVPCRHCGDLLPEQERICPHCGKDQTVAPAKGGAGAAAAPASLSGPAPGDEAPDPFAAPRGPNDFMTAGFGPHAADDGSARRRRKAIGVVALIAGVLLLGMAYDRYAKQRAAGAPPAALAQDAPLAPVQPATAARAATATGPVVRTPSATTPSTATATPSAAPIAPASPTTTPAAASPAGPATADAPAPRCDDALAALSLCARP